MKRQKLKEIMEAYKPKLLPSYILMLSMRNQQKAMDLAQSFMNTHYAFEKYRTEAIREELEELDWQWYMESVGFNWEIYDDWDFDWSMYD